MYWWILSFIKGQSSSASENAIGDVYKTRIPSTALSLNSFHAVRYYSKVVPSYDAAAVTNQNTSVRFPTAVAKVSKFLPQHCNSVLGQACTAHPNCLVSLLGSVGQTGLFLSSPQGPLTCVLLLMLWVRNLSDWDHGRQPRHWFLVLHNGSLDTHSQSGCGHAALTGSDLMKPNLL